MHHFTYKNGLLHAEDVSLTAIAEAVGTPFYCYSQQTLLRHFSVFQNAFTDCNALTAFSVKSSSNLAIIALLAKAGAGADVVSGGELRRARLAGIAADKIVFSGVGKTREEMALALEEGIWQFNIESEPELYALSEVATAIGKTAPIALRVNPDVAAGGHEKISTGKAEDKFGISWAQARALYKKAATLPGITIKGVDIHIGSQILALAPFETAFTKVAELVRILREDGIPIERVDLGGGLGVPYHDDGENSPHPEEYAAVIKKTIAPLDVQLIFEPGRMISANAGILVTQVIYDKIGDARRFLIVDAAMNDLIRPTLYDAYHHILPVKEASADAPLVDYDVVGPICETGDRFAAQRALPVSKPGELLAFLTAGAYGAVQANQYNSRPLVPEVLVHEDQFRVIRRRPSFEEMIALET